MPLDGILLNNLCKELQSACDCRIEKISQPSKDELVIALRRSGFSKKLFVSARPGSARIHFTEAAFENPDTPPMLCMLFRKHIAGSKVVSVTQDGFERIVTISLLASNELGELRQLKLITELIGNQSNIILVGEDGRIIDAIRRSDIENSTRLIQPGAVYEPPVSLGKSDIHDPEIISTVLSKGNRLLSQALLDSIAGFSPLTAREVASAVDSNDVAVCELNDQQKSALAVAVKTATDFADNGTPYILTDANGTARDFSYMPIRQYGSNMKSDECNSFCEMLDLFYSERDNQNRLRNSSTDVFNTISNVQARAKKNSNYENRSLRGVPKRRNTAYAVS